MNTLPLSQDLKGGQEAMEMTVELHPGVRERRKKKAIFGISIKISEKHILLLDQAGGS